MKSPPSKGNDNDNDNDEATMTHAETLGRGRFGWPALLGTFFVGAGVATVVCLLSYHPDAGRFRDWFRLHVLRDDTSHLSSDARIDSAAIDQWAIESNNAYEQRITKLEDENAELRKLAEELEEARRAQTANAHTAEAPTGQAADTAPSTGGMLARLDAKSRKMLEQLAPKVWQDLTLLKNSPTFLEFPEAGKEAFNDELLMTFRRFPDLRFSNSRLSQEFLAKFRSMTAERQLSLLQPRQLRRFLELEVAPGADIAPVAWAPGESEAYAETWGAVYEIARQRAATIYADSANPESDLSRRRDAIQNALLLSGGEEASTLATPDLNSPFAPWILTELAADDLEIEPRPQ